MIKQEEHTNILAFDPLASEKGDAAFERTLRDGIVVIRKDHDCQWCRGIAKKGEYCRCRVDVYDQRVESYYFCEECTAAMGYAGDYIGHENLEKRFELFIEDYQQRHSNQPEFEWK